MDAVVVFWRSRLRQRWRAWLAVALLLGLGTGTGLACLAGARRTASSFGRVAAAGGYADVTTSHGLAPEEATPIVDGFTGVSNEGTVVGFVGFVEGIDPTLIKYFFGSWDVPFPQGRPVLRSGRLPRPDRAEEVLAIGRGVEKAGIEPGERITVQLFGQDSADPAARSLVVTGTGSYGFEAIADASQDRSGLYFSPAFVHANAGQLQAWSATSLNADPGSDIETQLVPQVLAAGWSPDVRLSETRSQVQDAVRPLVATLALLGSLALAATLVVSGQALVRQSDTSRSESASLLAMGVTSGQGRTLDALTTLSVALPGAVVAVVVAIGLSPLFPVGSLRSVEPDRGVSADLTVQALGAAAVVLVLLVVSARRALRSSRQPAAAASGLAPLALAGPAADTGMRLAMGGTQLDRRRFWATVAFSATALGLAVAGLVFAAALDRLGAEPGRYGVGWELTARNAYGEVAPEDVRDAVAGDDDIVGVSGAGQTQVVINDAVVSPALPVLAITEAIWPTVVEGAAPANDGEVLVGASVLSALGAEIGDMVTLQPTYLAVSGPPPVVKIVGTAIFPSIELAGLDPTRLDTGVAMTWARYQSLVSPATAEGDRLPDFTLFDLAEGVDPQTVIDRYAEGLPGDAGSPTEWLTSLAPAEVRETTRAASLIWTVIATLAITVVSTVGHSVATTVRRRRRDYAVLKALGFTRRQVASTVTWQSTITVTLALVVGLPLGTALGRWIWRVLARVIGVVDTPVLPASALLAVVAVALAAGALVATLPGVRAGRLPAVVLRTQ
jgi:hypothetical protein